MSCRGAELIEQLRRKRVAAQKEEEQRVLDKIRTKMERIKENQRKMQGENFREPQSHQRGIFRALKSHLFISAVPLLSITAAPHTNKTKTNPKTEQRRLQCQRLQWRRWRRIRECRRRTRLKAITRQWTTTTSRCLWRRSGCPSCSGWPTTRRRPPRARTRFHWTGTWIRVACPSALRRTRTHIGSFSRTRRNPSPYFHRRRTRRPFSGGERTAAASARATTLSIGAAIRDDDAHRRSFHHRCPRCRPGPRIAETRARSRPLCRITRVMYLTLNLPEPKSRGWHCIFTPLDVVSALDIRRLEKNFTKTIVSSFLWFPSCTYAYFCKFMFFDFLI